MTYFLTFVCYGAHLHGDAAGSVDRRHNLPGSPLLEADSTRALSARRLMDQPPYIMDTARRQVVATALAERCLDRGWELLAAHVRSNHVHIVVEADIRPERLMNDLKSYSSRALNRRGIDGPDRKRWAKHGSTRWLWENADISAAIRYVVDEQGERMAVFEASERGDRVVRSF